MCGELFLFRMIQQWYDSRIQYLGDHAEESSEYETEATLLVESAVECAKLIRLENIEPAALISLVQPCPFVSPAFLYDAFAKQALRASQNTVWSLNCRPPKYQSVERVLVEDCGNPQAAGLYVRMVAGLKKTHASIFTKREVVAGQAVVYTLSCSVTPDQQVECRIFCSPLLTPRAIPSLFQFHASNCVDPLFQPILQVVAMKEGNDKKIVVSDGQHCMQATMANDMVVQSKKTVQKHSVLQVLAFHLYNGSKWPCSSGLQGNRMRLTQKDSLLNSFLHFSKHYQDSYSKSFGCHLQCRASFWSTAILHDAQSNIHSASLV